MSLDSVDVRHSEEGDGASGQPRWTVVSRMFSTNLKALDGTWFVLSLPSKSVGTHRFYDRKPA